MKKEVSFIDVNLDINMSCHVIKTHRVIGHDYMYYLNQSYKFYIKYHFKMFNDVIFLIGRGENECRLQCYKI